MYNPYGDELVRTTWAIGAVALLIIVLRVIAKIRLHQLGIDDYLMLLALACMFTGNVMVTLAVHYGVGRNIVDLSKFEVIHALKFDYFAQTFGLAGSCFSRVAFIYYLIGLLATKKIYRNILWILMGSQFVSHFLCILFIYIQCPTNVQAIWDPYIEANCWPSHVQSDYGYFQGALNTATDLYLAAFPTYVFWSLKLELRLKISLMVLLSLGLFAMGASLVKTIQVHVLAESSDPTIVTVTLVRWLYIEIYLVIITASIPTIRVLVMSVRNLSSNRSNTHELNSRYAENSRSVLDSHKRGSRSRMGGLYSKHVDESGDGGSEENILGEHGITKSVDIRVTVGVNNE
ncbi:hypothetical protein ASPZODRAFT_139946 [Penicilliopsis zonata CBS 506.65]|uniref:Rhodopsin domain-containing protein n=1 Tax=Penicilliopsis zonata CBS 506.65 TaxID=1073090 RepID=A0A1L9SPG1_9EURO|nr:hypothetical protein ASPZODRAFT_139946 [Penicilliopsis zonata CBS 506.65]OJJ48993.1 hypothetical protein ASPZODRAFT_139946 [Penicilliopsis zonata CBS 506.65]